MKLIIDIDEDIKVAIEQMGLLRISNDVVKKVDKAIQHSTPLPDNATNAEVFTTIFGSDLHREASTKTWWEQKYKRSEEV